MGASATLPESAPWRQEIDGVSRFESAPISPGNPSGCHLTDSERVPLEHTPGKCHRRDRNRPAPFRRADPQSILPNGPEGLLDHRLAAVELRTLDHFFVFRIDIAAHTELHHGPSDSHQKSPGGRTLRLQECGNYDICVEYDPDHCSGARRSRRAFRACAISASISSVESWSRPRSSALFQDAFNHSGAEGEAVERMVISSFSAMERPNRLSITVFWSGERSFALWVTRILFSLNQL